MKTFEIRFQRYKPRAHTVELFPEAVETHSGYSEAATMLQQRNPITKQELTGIDEYHYMAGCADNADPDLLKRNFECWYYQENHVKVDVQEVKFFSEQKVTCASCGQSIRWIKTLNNKSMPVNADLITCKGNENIFTEEKNVHRAEAGELGHEVHFATCPQSKKWSKKK